MTNTITRVALSLVAACAVALSLPSAPHVSTQAVTLASYGGPEYRVPAPDDGTVNPVADCLFDQGYRGDGGDGVSAIYAPESAVAACAGEAVSVPDDSHMMGGAPDRMAA
jgi:hypothetical protein